MSFMYRCWLALVLSLLGVGSLWAEGLSIAHDPVPFAVRGQALTLKAKITGADEPQSVTLYYALFRDAAPFRVSMKATGLGYYVGTIDASLVAGVDTVSYYIEAQDKNGSITETAWNDVPFRRAETKSAVVMPAPMPAGPAAPAPIIAAPGERRASVEKESSWKTPALIVGGAAVVLGGAYALSQGGGGSAGDDGGGGGGTTNDPQGTYEGTVTTCLSNTGGVNACDSTGMSIVIDKNGVVFSETLKAGQQLTGNLSGNSFTLVSVSNQGGTNSTINFEGTVVGAKILGSVSGSANSSEGEGTYSGSFSANKQ
jgi:hypothetical protein